MRPLRQRNRISSFARLIALEKRYEKQSGAQGFDNQLVGVGCLWLTHVLRLPPISMRRY